MANQSIITLAGQQAITDAIATNTKISPSYFKVSYDNVAIDAGWTDIPNPVLQKPINAWFKANDNEFRLYCHILSTEVTQPVTIIGIYDINNTLLFITKLDPAVDVNQDAYIENRYILTNFENVIDFSEIPWDEYEQTLLIIDTLNKYGQLIDDHTTFEIALQDFNARLLALEAINIIDALNEHNVNLYAHPPIQNAIAKAGIFVRSADFQYVGQFWDEYPSFDATVTEDMVVFKDVDGLYKPALDNGEIQSRVIGIAKPSLNRVISTGFINISNQPNVSTFSIGDELYLSTTDPGVITNDPSDRLLGYYLGNNIMLLGSAGGAGGKGEVSFEDLTYAFLLNSNPYNKVYYDIFPLQGTINVVAGSATYVYKDSLYTIDSVGTVFETGDIINSTNTLYRFLVHVEADTLPELVEFSVDGGTTWNTLSELDKTYLYTNGFNTLRIRFTFNTTPNNFYSYGVLYEYSFDSYSQDTRMLEVWTADQDYPAGSIITLPNNATYTTSGKDLEIYVNRVRLIPGTDYSEVDERRVQFNIDILQGDIVVFTEKYGYVDTSIENKSRLDLEHDAIGQHVFTDISTGQRYRLAVDNGNLVLIPV